VPPRRESHFGSRRDLTDAELLDLLGWGPPVFASEEDRREAWEAHGDELLADRGGAVPGHRPRAFWDYDAPDAPTREQFLIHVRHPLDGPVVKVDSDALHEARLRYLAERGLLHDDEIAELGARAKEPYDAPDGVHRPQRRFDAVLEGLAGQHVEEESAA
jgi:hypothetical protein